MTSRAPVQGTPWYRNFWPWFIVVLLGTSVVASLATVVIAYRHRDVDVRLQVGGAQDSVVDRPSREPGR